MKNKKKITTIILAALLLVATMFIAFACVPSAPGWVMSPAATPYEFLQNLSQRGDFEDWLVEDNTQDGLGSIVIQRSNFPFYRYVPNPIYPNYPAYVIFDSNWITYNNPNASVWLELIVVIYFETEYQAISQYNAERAEMARLVNVVPNGVMFSYNLNRNGNVVSIWQLHSGSWSVLEGWFSYIDYQ